MIALGHLLSSIAGILHSIIFVLEIILLAYVILSWVSPDPRNPIIQFINGVCEPLLAKIREMIPTVGMFDLSPIIAFLGLFFLDEFLVLSLKDYGMSFVASAKLAAQQSSGVSTAGSVGF